jgi:5-methylcytosine-specific restriction endonuclease McrA
MPRHPKLVQRSKDNAKKRDSVRRWESEQAVEEDHQAFYNTRAWKLTRIEKLYMNPDCEYHDVFYPDDKGIIIPATEVDHVKSLSTHPELALTWSNLKSTCRSCHRKKTNLDKSIDRFREKNKGIIGDDMLLGVEKQLALEDWDKPMNNEKSKGS